MLHLCHMWWVVEMEKFPMTTWWLYDFRVGRVRIKILCNDNITPCLLNLGSMTMNDRLETKDFSLVFIISPSHNYDLDVDRYTIYKLETQSHDISNMAWINLLSWTSLVVNRGRFVVLGKFVKHCTNVCRLLSMYILIRKRVLHSKIKILPKIH